MNRFLELQIAPAILWLALVFPGLLEDQPSLDTASDEYVAALQKTMEESASPADIDHLLRLYSSDATYEHPRIGIAISSVAEIREGMAQFLGQTRHPTIRVLAKTIGRDVALLELELQFDVHSDSGWHSTTRHQITTLEFMDGLIIRVLDYW